MLPTNKAFLIEWNTPLGSCHLLVFICEDMEFISFCEVLQAKNLSLLHTITRKKDFQQRKCEVEVVAAYNYRLRLCQTYHFSAKNVLKGRNQSFLRYNSETEIVNVY